MMKEALDHMAGKNEHLEDQLAETKELLNLHKKLLDDALKNQASTLKECKESGTSLKRKMDEQA